ncbi:nitrogen assimilation regulatory protein NtrX domain protein [Leptospira kirschneri str. 200801925]|nr:nitrogen assimilation regulatory protein NtrX domain protein [Leptospira kirschneri str. 200801925]
MNVIPITIPPLRERTSDIPLLVDYYISKTLEENNLPPKKIESEAVSILQNHFWPGNIRELKT